MPDTAAAPQTPLLTLRAMQAAYLKGAINGVLSLIEFGCSLETIAHALRDALTEAEKIGDGK